MSCRKLNPRIARRRLQTYPKPVAFRQLPRDSRRVEPKTRQALQKTPAPLDNVQWQAADTLGTRQPAHDFLTGSQVKF